MAIAGAACFASCSEDDDVKPKEYYVRYEATTTASGISLTYRNEKGALVFDNTPNNTYSIVVGPITETPHLLEISAGPIDNASKGTTTAIWVSEDGKPFVTKATNGSSEHIQSGCRYRIQ